jgi:hypothetical protein
MDKVTRDKINSITGAFKRGKVGARETKRQLVEAGMSKEWANELVFHMAGGGDVIAIKEDGREVYRHSGLTEAEVDARLDT